MVLGFGIASAVLTLSRVLEHTLEQFPAFTAAFFFGLIGASAIVLYAEVDVGTPRRLAVALVGIVVNNAIVLIDVAEQGRKDGQPVDQAIASAVKRRTRPILLTTTTTIVGLAPLTMTDSTLWPPMAWAIISGLISSTALTLLVIPVLYRLLVGLELPWNRNDARAINPRESR